MSGSEQERVLALAAVFQAAELVQQLARRGAAPEAPLRASLSSVLRLDAADTQSVFGGVEAVRGGLECLRDRLGARASPLDMEIARYVMGMVQLQGRLREDEQCVAELGNGLEQLVRQHGDADAASDRVAAGLADLYTRTISLLGPRLMVQGEQGNLENVAIVNRVRAVLLAGIRAAWLWHQLGGRRWHLVLRRRRYVEGARAMLAELDA